MGCLSVPPLGPQKLCPHHRGRARSRPWVSNAQSPILGSWILKTWLGWDKLLPVPTESGGSSQTSHPQLFTLVHGAARSNRFSQQTAIPWAKSQPRGLSSREGFALGMRETTPPSGVSTDLSSLPAVLQPCMSLCSQVCLATSASLHHPKSCSLEAGPILLPAYRHAHMVWGRTWPSQKEAKQEQIRPTLLGAVIGPTKHWCSAVLPPPKLPECGTCSCALIQAQASCPSKVVGCRTGQQLQPILCR